MMRYLFLLIAVGFTSFETNAQAVSATSNEVSLDLSDPKKNYSISIPTIYWSSPKDSVTILKNGKVKVEAVVKSIYGLNSAKIKIEDIMTKKPFKEISLLIDQQDLNNQLIVSQEIPLPIGNFKIELVTENSDGFYSRVTRIVIIEK